MSLNYIIMLIKDQLLSIPNIDGEIENGTNWWHQKYMLEQMLEPLLFKCKFFFKSRHRKSWLVQPLWRTVWRFLKKTRVTVRSSNPTTGHRARGNHNSEKTRATLCSLQHYLRQPGHGSNLDVFKNQMDKEDVERVYNGTLLLLLSLFSRVRLCATPWTAAHQALPSLGSSRQEYWSGLPLPSPTVGYYSAIKRFSFWLSYTDTPPSTHTHSQLNQLYVLLVVKVYFHKWAP